MGTQERINDINKLGIFDSQEIRENKNNKSMFAVFESIEYYQIFHLTNSEIYYLDNETDDALNTADIIEDTNKGRIYCWS